MVKFAKVLFPRLVDREKEHSLLPLLGHVLALCLVSFFKVHSDTINSLTVGNRHTNHTLATVVLYDVGNDRLECLRHLFLGREFAVFVFAERNFESKVFEDIEAQVFVIVSAAVFIHFILDSIVKHIHNVDTDTLTHKSVVAA